MYATANEDGITLVEGIHIKQLTTEPSFELSWSPDSKQIAYITGHRDGYVAETGDLKVVTLGGRTRTLVAANGRYGGQMISLTWVRPAKGVRFRAPAPAEGVFAGGPVGRLAADGARVAYASCLNVFSWLPRSGTTTQVSGDSRCVGPSSRFEIYDLAVAGDRVAWGWKTPGQAPYSWFVYAATVGSAAATETLARGAGYPNVDESLAGSIVGSRDTLVFGVWTTTGAYPQGTTVETLYRATSGPCPCPAIAYGAAPRPLSPLVPLDTDGTRIAVLRYGLLTVIDTVGTEILSLPVEAAGAQLAGNALIVLVPGELRTYDVVTGAPQRTWPLPRVTVGRDCTYRSEPHCPNGPVQAELTLQDAANGLATYVLNGQVHVLRLADGRDAAVGFGTEARFTDTGLVYADGARIHLVSFTRLSLR